MNPGPLTETTPKMFIILINRRKNGLKNRGTIGLGGAFFGEKRAIWPLTRWVFMGVPRKDGYAGRAFGWHRGQSRQHPGQEAGPPRPEALREGGGALHGGPQLLHGQEGRGHRRVRSRFDASVWGGWHHALRGAPPPEQGPSAGRELRREGLSDGLELS